MQSNLLVIDQLLKEYDTEATPQAKKAIVNFAVLIAEKLVRNNLKGRSKKPTVEDVMYSSINKALTIS
jgi:hypothetical protein